jgi:hypothetical protein
LALLLPIVELRSKNEFTNSFSNDYGLVSKSCDKAYYLYRLLEVVVSCPVIVLIYFSKNFYEDNEFKIAKNAVRRGKINPKGFIRSDSGF